MRPVIGQEPLSILDEYAEISIAFEVTSVLDIADSPNDLGKFSVTERRLNVPYIKNYDRINGENPTQWVRHFDMSNWGLLTARVEGQLVGAAAVAFKTPSIIMLEDRDDLTVLWDIRVLPEVRGQGVGSMLFQAAEAWAKSRGCQELKVETQNINVPACRFYARHGCILKAVNRFAYPELPEEVQLLWYKNLFDSSNGSE